MNGLSVTELCCLFCCPPCPGRIAAKLAFLPPEPTYSLVPEPEPGPGGAGAAPSGTLRASAGTPGRWKLHLMDRADFQYSQRELDTIEVFLTKSSRGNRISCMYVRCVPGARYTVLFSHGNAVDLGQMSSFYIGLGTRLNCNIFSYDYSGYGVSSGKPSEKNLYADIDAAWQALRTRRRGAPRATGPRGRGPGRWPGCARAAPRGRPARAPGAAAAGPRRPGPRPGRRRRRTPPAGRQHPGRPARRAWRRSGGRLARLLFFGRLVPVLRPRPRRRARRRQEPPLSLPGLRQGVLQVLPPQVAPADAHRKAGGTARCLRGGREDSPQRAAERLVRSQVGGCPVSAPSLATGRAATRSSRAPTSWPATIGRTRARSASPARSAPSASPAATT
uniref:Alpha/beta hydrolase domain-containing protein 17A n=1 Tax=Balaenoptera musculus TaxID=9771 RepID=A0A8C0CZ03_BALMU